ncbi:MAG: hypothetical protein A2V52_02740 [Actinobacteria bacterium RBG_19FT_COMBO_54_7]|uniref:Uncharacterized protein n=1 Tax=Candidatus Solincola sediminis TaxID=1797199 RepID=A0A1F2WGJ2_9ACTN|nr:MAG: hypothetical protein A2Y75_04540 [Candidatus Solincola sediminis]OFW58251.1 MAG: hypothetical protein A2W01_04465 [Candidatus Solincola sediminis]OFW66969.1 MAG: hypothetical protein A2V52_02740 [Actinobacteria bacterium RBG_19FT_COMBO_54_7]
MNVPDRVVRMELISFFIKYPETVGSCETLSEKLGRDSEQVKRQMDELAELDILQKELIEDQEEYSYIPAISAKLSRKRPVVSAEQKVTNGPQGKDEKLLETGVAKEIMMDEDDLCDANGCG